MDHDKELLQTLVQRYRDKKEANRNFWKSCGQIKALTKPHPPMKNNLFFVLFLLRDIVVGNNQIQMGGL